MESGEPVNPIGIKVAVIEPGTSQDADLGEKTELPERYQAVRDTITAIPDLLLSMKAILVIKTFSIENC